MVEKLVRMTPSPETCTSLGLTAFASGMSERAAYSVRVTVVSDTC